MIVRCRTCGRDRKTPDRCEFCGDDLYDVLDYGKKAAPKKAAPKKAAPKKVKKAAPKKVRKPAAKPPVSPEVPDVGPGMG